MIFFLLHSLLITNLSIMMLEKLYLPSTQWTFSEAKCHSYLLAEKKKKKIIFAGWKFNTTHQQPASCLVSR